MKKFVLFLSLTFAAVYVQASDFERKSLTAGDSRSATQDVQSQVFRLRKELTDALARERDLDNQIHRLESEKKRLEKSAEECQEAAAQTRRDCLYTVA